MNSESPSPETRDAMDAVRDLLFGQKVEEIDSRFSDQEEIFKRTVDMVEDRIADRFKSMESFFKAELESVTSRIKESSDRIQIEKESTSTQFLELTKRIDNDFESVRQQASNNRDEARSDAYTKFSEMDEKLEAAVRTLKDFTEKEVEGLRASAADRQRVGDFMIDMGMRLQSDDLKATGSIRALAEDESNLELAG